MTIVDARRGVTAATATAADFTNHVPHNSHLLLQQLHCTTVITRIMITVQSTTDFTMTFFIAHAHIDSLLTR